MRALPGYSAPSWRPDRAENTAAGGALEGAVVLAITGANGHIGRALLARLAAAPRPRSIPEPVLKSAPVSVSTSMPVPVRALVRSSAAAQTLAQSLRPADTEIRCTDYTDLEQMADALAGCSAVIHLVGILRETPGNRYVDAHERAVSTLVAAAQRAGVRHIVALSILGADEQSPNACLRSRGRADQLLRSAPLAGTVLEVPMVLGGDDHASRALAARARRALSFTFRAESLEQPIDIEDVVSALLAWRRAVAAASQAASSVRAEAEAEAGAEAGAKAGTHTGMPSRLQLAGPVSLTRRALVQAAAARVGKR
ncbi:MAG: SDR family oxidoreductase, partial [Gammaproteobacteria bacterium]